MLFYTAQRLKSIPPTILSSFLIWLLIAIPAALFKFSNLWLSLFLYGVMALFAHYLLFIKPRGDFDQPGICYNVAQKLGRAVFAGSAIALVVVLSKTLGSFWGAVFSVFPSSYAVNLLIFHKQFGSSLLFKLTKTIPLGSPAFMLYAVAAGYFFPRFGIVFGTIISYLVAGLFVSLLLYWSRNSQKVAETKIKKV